MNDPSNESRCPRCGASFHCGVGDDAPCACSQVALDPVQQRALRALYPSCLCLSCLRAVAGGDGLSLPAGTPGDGSRES